MSLLNVLLGREEEAVHAAIEVGIVYSKEICKLLCSQSGVKRFFYFIKCRVGNVMFLM